ncbi:related to Suppressor of lethality of KEX2 GAS1 double null mutant protein 1 [Zygosaccharomyces bailii]|nr:related to Suppressor of lethality of KEX2 GAS1 double null mutant protein 1 [Zygosaccharomyces bailii]
MGHVSVAVGCSVGIPVGFSFLVAIVLWIRMHCRYKKEDKRDKELDDIIRDESGFISFDNLETLQASQEKKEFYTNNESVTSVNHGSSSSEAFHSPEDGTSPIDADHQGGRKSHDRQTTQSRYYVPAYRRNLNAYRIRQMPVGSVTNNGSNVSLDSTQNIRQRPLQQHQDSVYDQMIPVLNDPEPKLFAEQDSNDTATLQQNQQNNGKFIKNLRKQDLGSYYPKRTTSSTSLTQTNTNASASSLHTRSSSFNSAMKHTPSEENVFDTPKSATVGSLGESSSGKLDKPEDVYFLKNHDMKNTEIKEEDQYENEFTNYSESKREFINSLRPKRPGL